MPIKAVFIDLSGTLHVENEPTKGAVESLKRLRALPLQIKFVTNTSKESGDTLYKRLEKIGFDLRKEEIFSSLNAAIEYIKGSKLNPFYILSEDAKRDFPESDESNLDSVVIGLAPESYNYENLNKAFRILLQGCPLIAIHQGKYYKQTDGLALGPGCFVKGLEYAASTQAIVIGKPNKYFFTNIIPKDIKPNECVMIGDDIHDDIAGAMDVGMIGILVKTGKYLPNVSINPSPIVLENFAEAVTWIEKNILNTN